MFDFLKNILFISLWCGFPGLSVIAQEYITSIRHLSVEDGLSERYANSVYQDSKGFIWISTQFKVNRFDGKEFKHYSAQEHGLRLNTVHQIHEDKNGRLWFYFLRTNYADEYSDYLGIDVFDPQEEKSVPLETYIDIPFSEEDITRVNVDLDRNIWLLLHDGRIYKYDGKRVTLKFKIPEQGYKIFIVTSNNRIGLLKTGTFLLMDTIGNILTRQHLDSGFHNIYDDHFDHIWLEWGPKGEQSLNQSPENTSKVLWLSEEKAPARHFPLTIQNQPADFEVPFAGSQATFHDLLGRIWTIYQGQINIYNSKGELEHQINDLYQEIVEGGWSNFFFDNENNAWLTTHDGVYFIVLKPNVFKNYLVSDRLKDNRGIYVDEHNNIYVNRGGLHVIDSKTSRIKRLTKHSNQGLACDKDGKLWSGNYGDFFESYDPRNQKKELFQFDPEKGEKGGFSIRTVFQDSKSGRIWLGTRGRGIAYAEPASKTIKLYDNYNEFDEIRSKDVSFFFENKEGIWLSSDAGIYLMDAEEGIKKRFEKPFHSSSHHWHEDEAGIVWMATFGDGLVRWNRKTNEFKQYTTQDGLSHDIIYAVYEDDFGFLWLPGNNGLMRFNKKSGVVTNFLPKDGIPHKEFNYSSHFKTKDDRLFFGGLGGITSFNPKDFIEENKNGILNKIQILNFEKLDLNTGQNVDETDAFLKTPIIHLNPSDRSFYLKFQLPHFDENEKIRYGYKIQGWQNQWSFIEENFIRIHGLPYGEYTLSLKAQNSKGHETNEILEIPIFVEKPIYLKTWFLILSGLLLTGLIYAFFNWRVYSLEQDKKHLETEVSERTKTISQQKEALETANATKDRLFAIIGHDLRGPLFNLQGIEDQFNYLLETGQTKRLKELGGKMEKTAKYLTDTLNNLLNWSMHNMGTFPYEPEKVYLRKATGNIFALFESTADAKGIELLMEVPSDVIAFVDKNAISTVLRNLVSNAIKFTDQDGQVKINAFSKNGFVYLKVSDTGIGMSTEQTEKLLNGMCFERKRGTRGEKSTGLGLMLVKDLVEQNKGKVKIKSTIDFGTVFELILPSK